MPYDERGQWRPPTAREAMETAGEALVGLPSALAQTGREIVSPMGGKGWGYVLDVLRNVEMDEPAKTFIAQQVAALPGGRMLLAPKELVKQTMPERAYEAEKLDWSEEPSEGVRAKLRDPRAQALYDIAFQGSVESLPGEVAIAGATALVPGLARAAGRGVRGGLGALGRELSPGALTTEGVLLEVPPMAPPSAVRVAPPAPSARAGLAGVRMGKAEDLRAEVEARNMSELERLRELATRRSDERMAGAGRLAEPGPEPIKAPDVLAFRGRIEELRRRMRDSGSFSEEDIERQLAPLERELEGRARALERLSRGGGVGTRLKTEPPKGLPTPERATPEELADHLGLTGRERAKYLASRVETERPRRPPREDIGALIEESLRELEEGGPRPPPRPSREAEIGRMIEETLSELSEDPSMRARRAALERLSGELGDLDPGMQAAILRRATEAAREAPAVSGAPEVTAPIGRPMARITPSRRQVTGPAPETTEDLTPQAIGRSLREELGRLQEELNREQLRLESLKSPAAWRRAHDELAKSPLAVRIRELRKALGEER